MERSFRARVLTGRGSGIESEQNRTTRALFEIISPASLLYCLLPVVERTLTARPRTLPMNTDIKPHHHIFSTLPFYLCGFRRFTFLFLCVESVVWCFLFLFWRGDSSAGTALCRGGVHGPARLVTDRVSELSVCSHTCTVAICITTTTSPPPVPVHQQLREDRLKRCSSDH